MRPFSERYVLLQDWDWKEHEAIPSDSVDHIVYQNEHQTTYGNVITIEAQWNFFAVAYQIAENPMIDFFLQ